MQPEDQLRKYRSLCLKNKQMLRGLSEHVFNNPGVFEPPANQHAPVRQQYEIILEASKDSIQLNAQLQTQLEEKLDLLRSLKVKSSKQKKQLHGLDNEVSRATGCLKREKISRRDLLKSEEDLEQMKRDITVLKKRRAQLVKQQINFDKKQDQLKVQSIGLDQNVRELEFRGEAEEAETLKVISELQEDLRRQKEELISLREANQSRPGTPDKNLQLKKNLELIQMEIRKKRQMI